MLNKNKKNLITAIMFIILGSLCLFSFYILPNLFCKHSDYICGAPLTLIGLVVFIPVGVVLIVVAFKR